jgi:LacI family transcriptional regulator
MPNIHDVAKLAGVHRSTVSRVLTGQGSVSEKSRKKVVEAARKINYHINTVASALKSQRKTAIGLLSFWNCSPNPSESYYQQILTGIIDEITRSKYHLLLNNIEGSLHPENEELKFCFESLLAGVIMLSPRVKSEEDLSFLKRVNIPALLLLCRPESSDYSWVDLDNRKGAQMATQHLIQLGHKKIGYIGGEIEYSSNARDRYLGYKQALKKAGITPLPEWVSNKVFSYEHGRTAAEKFIALPKEERPTAIFCATDTMAFGAMRAIQDARLRIPEDLSVVGFDDYEQAFHSNPPLTTIRQSFYHIGQQAVQLLESMVKEKSSEPRHILVEPELKVRQSTGKPKA